MQSNIHVLGIAPYEGIAAVMSRVAQEFPQMELTLHVGDLQQGVEIAKRNFHGNYDVVISRGGTAKMLRQQLSLPVIEIEVSMYDLLCTLKLADQPDPTVGRTAMVSYDNITRNAQMLCQLMNYNIDILTIDSPEEVEPTLQRLQAASYETILCDVVANTTAKRLGLNSFLITSGIESVRQAFQYALQLCGSQERLRDENLFFRQLISGQIGQTVVFDDAGGLFLSTLEESSTELMALLQRELAGERTADRPQSQRDDVLHSLPTHHVRKIVPDRVLFRRPQDTAVSKPGRDPLLHPAGGGKRVLQQYLQFCGHHQRFPRRCGKDQPEQCPGDGHRGGRHRKAEHGQRPLSAGAAAQ